MLVFCCVYLLHLGAGQHQGLRLKDGDVQGDVLAPMDLAVLKPEIATSM